MSTNEKEKLRQVKKELAAAGGPCVQEYRLLYNRFWEGWCSDQCEGLLPVA